MRQETTCLFLIALPALIVGNELINNNAFISIIQVQSASPMLMATSGKITWTKFDEFSENFQTASSIACIASIASIARFPKRTVT